VFNSWSKHQISDPQILTAWGLRCLDHFDDTDLKCRLQFIDSQFVLTAF
jgi:hypothetical protein